MNDPQWGIWIGSLLLQAGTMIFQAVSIGNLALGYLQFVTLIISQLYLYFLLDERIKDGKIIWHKNSESDQCWRCGTRI